MTQTHPKRVFSSPQPTALVAGGSGVIGQAICRYFGQHQWHVGIHYHCNHVSAEQTSQFIHNAGGTVALYQANVQEPHQTQAMLQSFLDTHERLDVLIWAIGTAKGQLLARTHLDSWSDHLATNLTGCFHLLKAAAPIFERQQHGSVVLIGSLSGLQGSTGQAAYAASKAGLLGLMKSAAKEWGAWHIRVNAIFPGWHASPLSGTAFPNEANLENHLLKKTPSTQDVAKAVYGLALMEGVSGQTWNLDSRIL